jgi:hypothetical protein
VGSSNRTIGGFPTNAKAVESFLLLPPLPYNNYSIKIVLLS